MALSPLSLRPGESLEVGFRRILASRFAAAGKMLDDGCAEPFEERVRTVRKRIKQLRAVVRLLRPVLGEELYRAENLALRDAGRRLAVSRDAAALVATWEQVAEALGDLPPATGALQQALLEQREREASTGMVEAVAFQSVGAALRAVEQRTQEWPLEAMTMETMVASIAKTYRRGQRLWEKAHAKEATIPEYHEWRKRVKDTWYQLLVVVQLQPLKLEARVVAADNLGKQLGWVQDLTILEDVIAGDLGERVLSAPVREALSERIAIIRREAQREARRRSPALYVEGPKKFGKKLGAWVAE